MKMSLFRSVFCLLQREYLSQKLLSIRSSGNFMKIRSSRKFTEFRGHIHHHNCCSMSIFPHHLHVGNSSLSTFPSQHAHFSKETLQITETGIARLKQIVNSSEGTYLRVRVEGGGCSGFQYKFEIDRKEIESDDVVLTLENGGRKGLTDKEDSSSWRVVIDKTSLEILKGSTVDYETELIRSAFRIVDIPLAEQGCSCGASFNVKIE